MTKSVYQIPTVMIENLDAKTSGYDTAIQNINSSLTNDVVHNTGNETIDGVKTFSKSIIRQYDSSQQITDNYWHSLDIKDIATSGYSSQGLYCNSNTMYWFNQLTRPYNNTNYISYIHLNLNEGATDLTIGASANTDIQNTTYATSSTTLNSIATKGWVNNPLTSTNVVHRTGTETISDAKTFTDVTYNKILASDARTACLRLQNMKFAIGTSPSSEIDTQIQFRDTNDDWVGLLQHVYKNTGDIQTSISCRKQDKTTSALLGVGYNSSGNVYTIAPTPSDTTGTNGTQIATTGWVNTVGNNVVHRSGDETIGGVKTYTSSIYSSNTSEPLHVYSTTLDYTQTSTTFTSFILGLWDKSNTRVLELKYENRAGDNVLSFPIRDKSGNWHTSLAYVTNGTTAYGTCDTPSSATDNSTKIATTAWVNNHINNSTIKTKIVRWSLLNYNSLVTISNISSGYTAPNDGVVMYNSDSQDNPTINGKSIPIAGNDSGNEGPTYLPVAKGDVVKKANSTYNPIFVPFKY
jgi:hypothetical protein